MFRKYGCVALCIFCLVVLLFSFFTIFHLVAFLSCHNYLKHISKNTELPELEYLRDSSLTKKSTVLDAIIKNMGLMLIFMLQHSLQASESLKEFLKRRGLEVIQRLLYITGTCITLEILMFYWQPMAENCLWMIKTHNDAFTWWCFTIVHTLAWMAMYSSCFVMDISEFFGVKMVYYYVSGWPQPHNFKSHELKRLYAHIRHVSFSPLAVILIVHPVMQLDRLLLAYGFIVYMILRFKVDDKDYLYHERMFQKKVRYLSANLRGVGH